MKTTWTLAAVSVVALAVLAGTAAANPGMQPPVPQPGQPTNLRPLPPRPPRGTPAPPRPPRWTPPRWTPPPPPPPPPTGTPADDGYTFWAVYPTLAAALNDGAFIKWRSADPLKVSYRAWQPPNSLPSDPWSLWISIAP